MTTTTTAPGRPAGDKYEATAHTILHLLGGAENVTTLSHCVTRLRVSCADPALVDHAGLSEHPAVLGLMTRDTLHVIVGPAAVGPLAAALQRLLACDAGSPQSAH